MSTFSQDDGVRVLFRCDCVGGYGCGEQLELTVDDDSYIKDYWLSVTAQPATFFQAVRWWWQQRKMWHLDLQVSKNDLKRLAETIRLLTSDF